MKLLLESTDSAGIKTPAQNPPHKTKIVPCGGSRQLNALHSRAMSKSPTARFSDRVENYVRYRPGYPPEILDLLPAQCGLRPSHTAAAIASGPGAFPRVPLENRTSSF